MPYKPYWLDRLPEIVERLRTLSTAEVDRRAFESIFGVRRRRAIELMHELGSRRGRRGFVLDRCALLERLEPLETVAQYRARSGIERLDGTPAAVANGSNGTHSGPKHLVIEFSDEGELVGKLLALLHAASNGQQHPVTSWEERTSRELQYSRFEHAIQAFRKHSFGEAETMFAQACAGPDDRIKASAETYLQICWRREEKAIERHSLEDHYAYGVALLNDRRLPEARQQLELALRIDPCADHVYYALAACFALSCDMVGVYTNLRRAIELQPHNRITAGSDPDLQAALKDPVVEQLLNSSSGT